MSKKRPRKSQREKSNLSNKAPFPKRRRLLVTPQQFAYNSNERSMLCTDDKKVVSPISTESLKTISVNKTELDGKTGSGHAQEPLWLNPRKCASKNKMNIKSSPLHEIDIENQGKHKNNDIEKKIKKEEMKDEDWDEEINEESKEKEQVEPYTQDISECQTEKLKVLPGNLDQNTEFDVTTPTIDETDWHREQTLKNSRFDENTAWQDRKCAEENKGENPSDTEWWTSLQLDSDVISNTSWNPGENKNEIKNCSDGKEDLRWIRLEDDSKIESSTSTDSEYDLLCSIAGDMVTSNVWRFNDQKSSRVKKAFTNLVKNLSSHQGLDIAIWNYLKCYSRMEKLASQAVYGLIPLLSYCSKDDLSEIRKVILAETDERINSLGPTMDLKGKQQPKIAFKESYPVIVDGTLSSNFRKQDKAKSSVHSLITDKSYSLSRENREKVVKTLYQNRKRRPLYLKDESDESVEPFNPITLLSRLTWSSKDTDVWTLDFTTKRFRELIDDWHRLLKNPTFKKVRERLVYEVLSHTMSYWKAAVIDQRINDMRTLIFAGWPIEFPLNISSDEERWYHLPKLEERIFKSPALLTACSYGLKTSVEELLKLGASIDKYNKFSGEDPLTHSCKYGRLEVVKLMLKWKADPNLATYCCTNRLTTVPITIELVTNIDINNRSKILEELIYHGAATYSIESDDAYGFLDCLRSSYSHSLIKVCAVFDAMKILEPGLIRRFEFIQKQLFRYSSILADTIILFLDPRSCPEWMQVASEDECLN